MKTNSSNRQYLIAYLIWSLAMTVVAFLGHNIIRMLDKILTTEKATEMTTAITLVPFVVYVSQVVLGYFIFRAIIVRVIVGKRTSE